MLKSHGFAEENEKEEVEAAAALLRLFCAEIATKVEFIFCRPKKLIPTSTTSVLADF